VKSLADALRPDRPALADELLSVWHHYSDPDDPVPGDSDVLADRWGQGDADRVRRILLGKGAVGRALLREMEEEFSSPDAGQGESSSERDAS
jgi:hypothetical protein